jgi:hypothetical protein
MVHDARSCSYCRPISRAVGRLPGTRLGARERKLLLAAPSPFIEGVYAPHLTLRPLVSDRKTNTARQAASLQRAGLLVWAPARGRAYLRDEIPSDELPDRLQEKWIVPRLHCRTPLGDEIVRWYREELESWRPSHKTLAIRWDERLYEAGTDALNRCPDCGFPQT